MRKLAVIAWLVTATSLALPAAAAADPSGPNLGAPITITCSNGETFTVNPGPLKNVGRVAWVVDSNSVMVTSYLAFTNGTDTFVLFDSKKGLENQGGLVTCTGDVGGGFSVLAKGFFTPR
jgi:hypothetical protein